MVSSIFTLLALPALALCAPATLVPRGVQAGKASFRNNCPYSVKVEAFPGSGCSSNPGATVASGSTWSDKLQDCSGGNTALKVYEDGKSKPMQFEYGISGGMLWYDMSFIDCISGSSDMSECAGTAWAMKGNDNCKAWQCNGPNCCEQGYCDPYATNMAEEPTAGCGAAEGITDSSQFGVVIDLC
ncbi:unnamed protein product [Periconia digitata]|uniref:Uncharacterized protein n=1 Tax=Periconia digitata TaxID=1303443 RepID=A0A9W4USG4_9PLEO|nr:unnamed protein product [Periconia digitata]